MILSMPSKAPPQMKRMLWVSTWMNSWWGCFRPPWGGTLDATTLTEAGYVGDDVENILLRLVQAADYDIELAERGIIYIDEMDKRCAYSGCTPPPTGPPWPSPGR